MSWTMWHVNGTGFDVANADPAKYREFIRNHAPNLYNTPNTGLKRERIDELLAICECDATPDLLEEVRDQTDMGDIAEPVAAIMTAETNIRFIHPGLTDESEEYVIFCALYPWNMTESERSLKTFEQLRNIMGIYAKELGVEVEDDVDLVYAG